jgi:hypothetical protein
MLLVQAGLIIAEHLGEKRHIIGPVKFGRAILLIGVKYFLKSSDPLQLSSPHPNRII